jgi:hypothetical protein
MGYVLVISPKTHIAVFEKKVEKLNLYHNNYIFEIHLLPSH